MVCCRRGAKIMKKEIKRTWKQVLSFVLCAAMILGLVLQFDMVRAKAALEPTITQWNLTISEGAIGLNLYFTGISDADADNVTVKVDGASYKLGAKLSDGSRVVSHRVKVKEVSKVLAVEVYKGTTKVNIANAGANGTLYCAVESYLNAIKDRNDIYGDLAKSLLNYAACVTNYTDGVALPIQIEKADLSAYKPEVEGDLPTCIEYKGSLIVLSDTFAIRHYFQFYDSVTGGSMFVDGKSVGYHETSTPGLIYVEISDIRTWDVDHMFTFLATANGMQITYKYSVLSYAYRAIE